MQALVSHYSDEEGGDSPSHQTEPTSLQAQSESFGSGRDEDGGPSSSFTARNGTGFRNLKRKHEEEDGGVRYRDDWERVEISSEASHSKGLEKPRQNFTNQHAEATYPSTSRHVDPATSQAPQSQAHSSPDSGVATDMDLDNSEGEEDMRGPGPLEDLDVPKVPLKGWDERLQAKLSNFHTFRSRGTYFNDTLLRNKAFRNPNIYSKLVDMLDIDESGTNFNMFQGEGYWNPKGKDESRGGISKDGEAKSIAILQRARAEERAQQQQPGMRSSIDFAPGRGDRSQTQEAQQHRVREALARAGGGREKEKQQQREQEREREKEKDRHYDRDRDRRHRDRSREHEREREKSRDPGGRKSRWDTAR